MGYYNLQLYICDLQPHYLLEEDIFGLNKKVDDILVAADNHVDKQSFCNMLCIVACLLALAIRIQS